VRNIALAIFYNMRYEKEILRVTAYTVAQCMGDRCKLSDLIAVYESVFNAHLSVSCSNCISDGILRLQLEIRKFKNKEIMEKQKENAFIMKPNTIIDMTYSTGEVYIPQNMTDKIAVKLLKLNSAYLTRFSKYPKDKVIEIIGEEAFAKLTTPMAAPGSAPGDVTMENKGTPEEAAAKEAEAAALVAAAAALDEEAKLAEAGSITIENKGTPGQNAPEESKIVADPGEVEALVKNNSKDALLTLLAGNEKATDKFNPDMNKAQLATVLLENK